MITAEQREHYRDLANDLDGYASSTHVPFTMRQSSTAIHELLAAVDELTTQRDQARAERDAALAQVEKLQKEADAATNEIRSLQDRLFKPHRYEEPERSMMELFAIVESPED